MSIHCQEYDRRNRSIDKTCAHFISLMSTEVYISSQRILTLHRSVYCLLWKFSLPVPEHSSTYPSTIWNAVLCMALVKCMWSWSIAVWKYGILYMYIEKIFYIIKTFAHLEIIMIWLFGSFIYMYFIFRCNTLHNELVRQPNLN